VRHKTEERSSKCHISFLRSPGKEVRMTTMFPVSVTCGVCGAVGEQLQLASTSTFGAPDLDTRPAPLARFNLHVSIQECSNCGFCSPAIELGTPELLSVVESGLYRALLRDRSIEETARRFRCAANIAVATGDSAGAGWALLQAAWAFDDREDHAASAAARAEAITHWESARRAGAPFAGNRGSRGLSLGRSSQADRSVR
jgi:hypothetical protein